MPNPKRRTSKSSKNSRRSHHAYVLTVVSTCPSCGGAKRSHRVCSSCGFYDKDRSVAI